MNIRTAAALAQLVYTTTEQPSDFCSMKNYVGERWNDTDTGGDLVRNIYGIIRIWLKTCTFQALQIELSLVAGA